VEGYSIIRAIVRIMLQIKWHAIKFSSKKKTTKFIKKLIEKNIWYLWRAMIQQHLQELFDRNLANRILWKYKCQITIIIVSQFFLLCVRVCVCVCIRKRNTWINCDIENLWYLYQLSRWIEAHERSKSTIRESRFNISFVVLRQFIETCLPVISSFVNREISLCRDGEGKITRAGKPISRRSFNGGRVHRISSPGIHINRADLSFERLPLWSASEICWPTRNRWLGLSGRALKWTGKWNL